MHVYFLTWEGKFRPDILIQCTLRCRLFSVVNEDAPGANAGLAGGNGRGLCGGKACLNEGSLLKLGCRCSCTDEYQGDVCDRELIIQSAQM